MKEKEKDIEQEDITEDGELVTLINDDGEEQDFIHVATIDYKGKWYVVFEPADEDCEESEEAEVVIYALGEDDKGEDMFLPIEDEKLLDEVFAEFLKEME